MAEHDESSCCSNKSLPCYSVDEQVLQILWEEQVDMNELLEFSFDRIEKLAKKHGNTISELQKEDLWEYVQRMRAHPGLNVNCCDMRGLRALEVCAQNGDVDASVELLRLRALDPDHVQAALLVAVQRGDLVLTKILLDGAHGPCTVPVGNMTPLMAAAIAGDLEITKMLLDRGHVIQKPHEPGCLCAELCREQSQKHGERLSQSQLRRNAFRALSSPVYILLTSDDPVLTAFTLSRDLQRLADSTPEFQVHAPATHWRCEALVRTR
ncbi:transient-receptor-potential-like protein [Ixodes scapularis]|uniref:transient-receptor-potential-like protein n=1 Tax=Ixodes scapularis TaxID=6945 RepID=UPI001C38748F|nr:transient-receptor-potential-like protein [Ixodes scapularis]